MSSFSYIFFVKTMKYCSIGTETIIHCSNKETFSNYFLAADTEKLFFLLLIVKICAEEILSRYMFVYIQTCIVDLISGPGPFYVINKTERVSLYARACFFTNKKKFFLFQNLLFSNKQIAKNHLQFLFYNFNTLFHTFKIRMIRR